GVFYFCQSLSRRFVYKPITSTAHSKHLKPLKVQPHPIFTPVFLLSDRNYPKNHTIKAVKVQRCPIVCRLSLFLILIIPKTPHQTRSFKGAIPFSRMLNYLITPNDV
ncbi:hypothetical protein, partial [Klebsiella pneumoniae]|uniref:hypothetical protein n=1 Tax=Klebsiella pneumoniae TaxID=573 RepID=UPI001F1C47A3